MLQLSGGSYTHSFFYPINQASQALDVFQLYAAAALRFCYM